MPVCPSGNATDALVADTMANLQGRNGAFEGGSFGRHKGVLGVFVLPEKVSFESWVKASPFLKDARGRSIRRIPGPWLYVFLARSQLLNGQS